MPSDQCITLENEDDVLDYPSIGFPGFEKDLQILLDELQEIENKDELLAIFDAGLPAENRSTQLDILQTTEAAGVKLILGNEAPDYYFLYSTDESQAKNATNAPNTMLYPQPRERSMHLSLSSKQKEIQKAATACRYAFFGSSLPLIEEMTPTSTSVISFRKRKAYD